MSAGNPEIVLHDGKLVRSFVDEWLSLLPVVDVHSGSTVHHLGDPHFEWIDNMPWIEGDVLTEEYEPAPPIGNATCYRMAVPWESITRIEVF